MQTRTATTVKLGLAQTLAWASSYYLPAVLAAPMAAALGTATSTVFAAFSLA
ncbi:MAG: MFS transporter, partial [Verrucomicrobiota bacterium]